MEVLMWMKHLQEIKEKRKKGVEKTAAKRKEAKRRARNMLEVQVR